MINQFICLKKLKTWWKIYQILLEYYLDTIEESKMFCITKNNLCETDSIIHVFNNILESHLLTQLSYFCIKFYIWMTRNIKLLYMNVMLKYLLNWGAYLHEPSSLITFKKIENYTKYWNFACVLYMFCNYISTNE